MLHSRAGHILVLLWLGAGCCSAVTLDFDSGTALQPVGSDFAAQGVTFSNTQYSALYYSSAPLAITSINGLYFPPSSDPLVATFSTPALTVSVIAVSVGSGGAQLLAFDATATQVDSDSAIGTGIGTGNFETLTVTAPAIAYVEFSLLNAPGFDARLFDDFTFVLAAVTGGDPHFLGFHHQAYDFTGDAGQVYSLISSRTSQVNFLSDHLPLVENFEDRQYMREVGIRLADDTTVHFDAGSAYSRGTITVNGLPYAAYNLTTHRLETVTDELDHRISIFNADALPSLHMFDGLAFGWQAEWTYSACSVRGEEFEHIVYFVDIHNRPDEPMKRGWSQGLLNVVTYDHVDMRHASYRAPHGLVGQSLMPSDRNVARDGGFRIEGDIEDYVVEGMFSTPQLYSQFEPSA